MAEYIEREAIQKRLNRIVEVNNLRTDLAWFTPYGVNALIEEIPAADVRPVVRGKWEEVEVIWLEDVEDQPDAIASMFCPKCQRFANHVYHYGDPTSGMNYCPNCGAKMRYANCTETTTADEEREVLNVRDWLKNGARMEET